MPVSQAEFGSAETHARACLSYLRTGGERERRDSELRNSGAFIATTTFIRDIGTLLQIRQFAQLRSASCSMQGLGPTHRVAHATPSRDLTLGFVQQKATQKTISPEIPKVPSGKTELISTMYLLPGWCCRRGSWAAVELLPGGCSLEGSGCSGCSLEGFGCSSCALEGCGCSPEGCGCGCSDYSSER